MKTELDFTKVPLDKWVDLCDIIEGYAVDLPQKVWRAYLDIRKIAEVQVKEEVDLNKELAEAYMDWVSDPGSEVSNAAFSKLSDAVSARKKLLGLKEKPVKDVKRENALAPVEEIIK